MELAEPFEMTQPAISQHLKVLEDAGLIVRRVEGTKRPRRLAKAGIEAMDQWLAMLRKALEKNYDRLDEVLATMEHRRKERKAMSKMTLKTEGDTHIVVTRRFAAPPEAVYRAHTDPNLIQKWLLGPEGWTMPVCISEARPGGKIRYEWTDGKGGGFHLTGEYLELEPYGRIVHVERMHLPDPTPDNHVETQLRSGRRRHVDDNAHDPARCADAGGHACYRNGARNGSELRPAGRNDLAYSRKSMLRESETQAL